MDLLEASRSIQNSVFSSGSKREKPLKKDNRVRPEAGKMEPEILNFEQNWQNEPLNVGYLSFFLFCNLLQQAADF